MYNRWIGTTSYDWSFVCNTKRPRWWPHLNIRKLKFGRSTPRSASRSTLPELTSSGQDEVKFGRSTPRCASRSTPIVVTSSGQVEFKFGRSTPRSAGRSTPCYWHLVVKMSSNLADLPLDLLADLPPWNWHLVVRMISNLADLPPSTNI